jgi:hypothetical protein
MFLRAVYFADCRLLRIQNRVSGPYSLYTESDPDSDPALPKVLDPYPETEVHNATIEKKTTSKPL